MILGIVSAPAVFADIIINPAESCRTEGDRPDDNRRSSTKLVVKGFKKSWIKFDLGELDVGHLETATLTVAAIDNESGNSCDLSVVNDSYTTGKDWTSDDITWNNAPANDTLSDSALTTDATLITNFAVDGSAGTPFVIDILAALQADTDGIVQFVLHNSNGQISFAPHDHPEATWRPFIDATEGAKGQAKKPYPAKGATEVCPMPVLSWTPGEYAPSVNGHKVYFSENFDDVNEGLATADRGIRSEPQFDTAELPFILEFVTTYYWRVDEANSVSGWEQGDVWQFTVEPFAYPVAGTSIIATASSFNSVAEGPENTINGSGLDDNDLHSAENTDMWLSSTIGQQPTWIQYELDQVYKLHQMLVWNHNVGFESILGFGLKDVTIEYSIDGADWKTLGGVPEFAQAPGQDGYAYNTTVDFGGVPAKYIRLTANSNWGGLSQYGLSEVRFFYIPVLAGEPDPDSGTTDMDVDNVTLSWRAGREAASHDVYFSTDEQAVIDETISPVSIPANSSYANYDTGALELAQTYYWKVNEVNEAGTPTTWQGDVSNFTTREFLIVDDFEDYNDFEPDRIFDTWIDGWADPTKGGSQVGYAEAPFAEQTIVHGGQQSMPVNYDNSTANYSEAERSFAAAQNWTEAGAATLVLYFHGNPGNTGQLYVKLNGAKVAYPGDAADIAEVRWKQWNIDLASFGVNLQSVTTLSIGIDGSGASGTLYVDDILLYRSAPEVVVPSEEIWIEAEAADTITEPMKIYDDPAASAGKYIGTTDDVGDSSDNPPAPAGTASYTFTVAGGTYKISGRINISGGNSFWVQIQGAAIPTETELHSSGWVRWNDPPSSNNWFWNDVFSDDNVGDDDPTVLFTMPAGTYTLEIAYRENGALLDVIVISKVD